MSDLSYDLPIKIDAPRPRPCPHCHRQVMHKLTVYKDAEYGVCFACGAHTAWVPGTEGRMRLVEVRTEDRTRRRDDFKRNYQRQYRKIGKNWVEEWG